MMTEFVFKSLDPYKIYFNQSINYLLMEEKKTRIKELRNSNEFINHSQTIDDPCQNLEDYNLTKKRKKLIVFDNMRYSY